jgi:phosphohistidine phosphatase
VKILLVRHAIAQETSPTGDRGRRLSREGREKFERGAAALAALVPELELVVSSPLARAKETAAILTAACPAPPRTVEDEMLASEGDGAAVVRFLAKQKGLAVVALVGHEPNLSQLEGLLLTGKERSVAVMKKGGAALLESPGAVAAGSCTLLWHLTPGQLRDLAP